MMKWVLYKLVATERDREKSRDDEICGINVLLPRERKKKKKRNFFVVAVKGFEKSK